MTSTVLSVLLSFFHLSHNPVEWANTYKIQELLWSMTFTLSSWTLLSPPADTSYRIFGRWPIRASRTIWWRYCLLSQWSLYPPNCRLQEVVLFAKQHFGGFVFSYNAIFLLESLRNMINCFNQSTFEKGLVWLSLNIDSLNLRQLLLHNQHAQK